MTSELIDPTAEGLVSVRAAAAMLRVGRTKIYDLISHRDLPTVHADRPTRVRRQAIRQYATDRLTSARKIDPKNELAPQAITPAGSMKGGVLARPPRPKII